MKTLPDSPNLDHLRRQAKDLLAGLRDGRPGTTLADAQTTLAQQYGFRTWTDLKAEVDRRRGDAGTAGEEVARELADRFDLGRVTRPMTSVARPDDSGRQWMLDTDRGRWAVRNMDTWRPIVDAETDVALQEATAAAGVLVPAPVRSRSGAIVETVDGHTWRVNRWVSAGPPLSAPVSAGIMREVGRIHAIVHGLDLPAPDRISPWHTWRRSEEEWRQVAARARAARAGWAAAVTDALPALMDMDTIGEDATPPAPVLCHNNLGPSEVRRRSGGGLVVVDWHHAGGQPPSWELGFALMAWLVGPGGTVNEAGARALLDGYRERAGWVPPLDMAMFRGAITSWLNYALGLAEAALDAKDAEDRRFLDRSMRHLFSSPPSRATFERLLRAAVGAPAPA
jgi:Ser/Thr protein kinase RdoA (MazF antagonist)